MLNKIKEIETALELGCQHCALALTLTLPDICAKARCPESGKQKYIDWCNEYVVPLYSPLGICEKSFLTGEECYLLRCAFLHAGNFDIEKENVHFNLHSRGKSEKQGYYDLREIINGRTIIDLDVVCLCNVICEAAKSFYDKSEDKAPFHDRYISDVC